MVDGSLGYLDNSVQGTIYTKGQFNLDDTWRWGFNIARASSADYVRDFHIGAGDLGSEPTLLTSQIYAEGFGQGAYSRFDVRFYQTLNEVVVSSASCRSSCRATNTAISVSLIPGGDVSASMPERSMWYAATAPIRDEPTSR